MSPRTAATVWTSVRALFSQAARHDATGLATEIGFRSFLELFPFFVFLSVVGTSLESAIHIPNPATHVVEWMEGTLPPGAAEPIRQQLEAVLGTHGGGQIGFPVLGAVWLAAGSGAAMLKAMNRVYELEETRPFWERYLVGVWLTILGGLVLFGAAIVMAVGQSVAQGESGWFTRFADLVRWPLVLALLIVEAAVVFRVAPNHKPPWRFISPGAALFAVGWLAASTLFALYIDKSGGYAATYGVLGGVIVLLLWLQLTALALLLGAELNDVLAHDRERADSTGNQGRLQGHRSP